MQQRATREATAEEQSHFIKVSFLSLESKKKNL